MTSEQQAQEAAGRLLARQIIPTGTNLNLDIDTVARYVLAARAQADHGLVGEVERLRAALLDCALLAHKWHTHSSSPVNWRDCTDRRCVAAVAALRGGSAAPGDDPLTK